MGPLILMVLLIVQSLYYLQSAKKRLWVWAASSPTHKQITYSKEGMVVGSGSLGSGQEVAVVFSETLLFPIKETCRFIRHHIPYKTVKYRE